MEVHITDAVAATHDGLRRRSECKTDTWREVVAVWVDGRTVLDGTVFRKDHGQRLRVKVRQDVVLLPHWRRVFVARAKIDRQTIVHPDVILRVDEVHVLAHVRDQDVAQRERAAQAEHEVRQVVEVV